MLVRPLLNFVEDHELPGAMPEAGEPGSSPHHAQGASWNEVEHLLEWDLSPGQVGLIVLVVVAACLLPGVLRGLLPGLL